MNDLDTLKTWVGRESRTVDALHPFPARAMAAALDRECGLKSGDTLPPGWQWLYFLDTPRAAMTGADGHAKVSELLPPAPLPRRMWAAGSMEIEQPLRLGEPAQRRSVIQSIDAKHGKSGSLFFINLEHELSQGGQLCIREQQNLVYREMPSGPAALPPGEKAPQDADWTHSIVPDPVLLFRYSALTFNAHRIHYDRDYAVDREFYPALVVQGPLLATLLVEHLQRHIGGAALRTFRFRAVRPTFDTHAFTVNGRREGDRVVLWTADHQGYLCVSAEATLA